MHDLKGLRAYFNIGLPLLHFPLMAVVDYSGFRMSCQSILPIDDDTLVYGSADGGRHVYADHRLAPLLERAARAVNVKQHRAGRYGRTETISAPADLEGHVGTDSQVYLVDFSRVMPPETPAPGIRAANLFRLLRPEFVKQYSEPLCSDAYSAFVPAEDAAEHNAEITRATEHLRRVCVPAVARRLIATDTTKAGFSLLAVLHQGGVNCRYLGLVRRHVDVAHTSLRVLLLVEMAARVIKCEVRQVLRRCLEATRLPLEDARRAAVVRHLNRVFGDSDDTATYWSSELPAAMAAKFEGAFDDADKYTPGTNARRIVLGPSREHAAKLFARIAGELAWIADAARAR